MNVDIRFYSILPHFLSQDYERTFWKPICDMFRQRMANYEVYEGLNTPA
jgi:hypothetical protein